MSEFIEFLSPKAQADLDKANESLLKMISNVKVVNETMAGIKTPSGSDAIIKKLTADYDAQAKTIQNLQNQLEKLARTKQAIIVQDNGAVKLGSRLVNTTREQSIAQQILRAETDRNFRANTLLGGAYARASAQLLILKKEAKDAAITYGEFSVQAQKASKAALEMDGRIKAADASAGDFQRNVGNYSGGLVTGFQKVFSSVRQLAYILPGIGIAGIFGFVGEGLVKIFTNGSEAIDKFKESITDVVSTVTEKAATLETVSKVINDTKTSQEQFNYALKLAQQEGISLNAIEEARKGNLALINKELLSQIEISIKKAQADKLINLIAENEIQQTKNLRKEKEDYNAWYRKALRYVGQYSLDAFMQEQALNKMAVNDVKELKKENAEYYDMLKKLGLEYLLDEKKKDATQKERIRNNYAEAESLFNLRIAKLEELKLLQKEIQENENTTDYGRLEARKEFSRLSLEILEEQYKKENALNDLKLKEDLDKANATYNKNKKNGFNDVQNASEYTKAIADITNRYNNEKALSDINYSRKFKENAYSDAEFNEKLLKATFDKEEKNRKKTLEATQKLNEQINKSEQKKYEKIANDETKTTKARQLAFQEYEDLAYRQINTNELIELSQADPSQYDVIIQKYKDLREAIDSLESPLDKANKKLQDFLKSQTNDFFSKGLEELGISSANIFLHIEQNGQSTFQNLLDGAKNWQEQMAVTFQAVGDVFQDINNQMFQSTLNRLSAESDANKKQTDIALAFAGSSQSAQDEIKRQSAEKEKEIQRKQFKAKKQQTLFNIAVDTAQAIVSAVAQSPLTFGLPFSAFAAAIGLAEAAVVQGQKMPEFFKGTNNAPAGLAWTQERGAEVITDKNNRVKTLGSSKGAMLTKLDAGDKVYTAEKSKQLMFDSGFNEVIFNTQLSNMMQSSGIGMSDSKQPIVIVDMDSVVRAIENKQESHLNIDKNGFKTYISNGHSTKELLDNQVSFKRQTY